MQRRRSGRFVFEVGFLAIVAAVAALAKFGDAGVIAVMAIAWVFIALIEWTIARDEPHYGRGLPPRFYVPQVALPPPRAVTQFVATPYAAAYNAVPLSDEQETWIAPAPEEWGTTLHDWPVADVSPAPPTEVEALTELIEHDFGDPVTTGEPVLPPEPAPPLPEVEQPVPLPVAPKASAPPLPEHAVVVLAEPEAVIGVARHHLEPPPSETRRGLFKRAGEERTIEVPAGPPPGRGLPAALQGRRGR